MKSYKILLIEDDEVDIIATKKAFEKTTEKDLIVATNADQAMEILNDPKIIRPLIILLDINLPKTDGFELLKNIKKSKELRHIPVIMMTSSNNEEDILKAYKNYAAGYLTKPIDIKQFTEKISALEKYWNVCEI